MTDTTASAVIPAGDASAEVTIERVVADAAQSVEGVHALGSPAGRAFAGAASRVSGRDAIHGVRVVPLNDRTRVEVSFVAEYPVEVRRTAEAVQAKVAEAIAGRIEGRTEVNVEVADVFTPLDRQHEEEAAARAAKVQEAKENAQAKAKELGDKAQATAKDVGAKAQATAKDVGERAQATAADVSERTRAAAADAGERTRAAAADASEKAQATVADVQVKVQGAREQAADRIEEAAAKRSKAKADDDVTVEVTTADGTTTAVTGDTVVVAVTEPAAADPADTDGARS